MNSYDSIHLVTYIKRYSAKNGGVHTTLYGFLDKKHVIGKIRDIIKDKDDHCKYECFDIDNIESGEEFYFDDPEESSVSYFILEIDAEIHKKCDHYKEENKKEDEEMARKIKESQNRKIYEMKDITK